MENLTKNDSDLYRKLKDIMNMEGVDSNLNTPDSALAEYLIECLYAYKRCVESRDHHYAFDPNIVNPFERDWQTKLKE